MVYTTLWQLHNHTEHNCCMRLATFSLHPVQNSTTISRSIVRLIDPCVLIPPGVVNIIFLYNIYMPHYIHPALITVREHI